MPPNTTFYYNFKLQLKNSVLREIFNELKKIKNPKGDLAPFHETLGGCLAW
jgi:hypothetical protein